MYLSNRLKKIEIVYSKQKMKMEFTQ